MKIGIYQCKDCKTVFNGWVYRWKYGDGPWVPESYNYDELIFEEQSCRNCKSKNISFLGFVKIPREMFKKMVEEDKKHVDDVLEQRGKKNVSMGNNNKKIKEKK